MALQYREEVESSQDIPVQDIPVQDEMKYTAHQSTSSEVITSVEKMKKGIDQTIKAIENAHNTTYEMKVSTDEMKTALARKKGEMEKLEEKLEDTKKQAELDNRKVSEIKIEINKINIAIEKIREVEQNLDQKYLERSQNELIDTLVRITSEAEKAQSNLNVTKKIEEITLKKLENVGDSFNQLKIHTLNKIDETEKVISNVAMATQQIIKSYEEITAVSKELFRSATSTTTELKEGGNYELEEIQQY